MGLKQLLPQLASLQAETNRGNNMAWKVLYANRNQPLLVPLDLVQARRSIAFFMRNPLLRYWGHLLLTLDRWLPRARLLPTVRLPHFPGNILFGSSDPKDSALFCGFPGPLQKLTLYCPDPDGGLGKVAKLALAPSANRAIEHEAHWLRKLGRTKRMTEFLPHLLLQGALPCGRRYIAMQALPAGASSSQFDQRHFNFLRLMAQQKPALYVWNQSQAYRRLYKRIHKILPLIDEDAGALMQAALADIDHRIGHRELPACMVHSDFAPWNLRLTSDRLFVFDWEYAEDCGNPLQDYLHFHLLPRALHRRSLRSGQLPRLLAATAAYADSMFGVDSGVGYASAALTLQYLLDTVSFYVEASGYLATEHPVMRTYLQLLHDRKQWLPEPDIATEKSIDTYDQPQYGAP